MVRNTDQEGVRRHYLVNTTPINETMNNLENYFINSPVMLDITKLPEIICLKYLAYYLALSSKKFLNYGEILWEDSSWLNNATRIHIVLRKVLEKKLGITLSYAMSPAELRFAKNAGLVLISSVGSEKDISNLLSCEVTKELALDLLNLLSEFSYLFDDSDDAKGGNKQNPSSNLDKEEISSIPPNQYSLKPSEIGHDSTHNLKLAVERLLKENPSHDLMPTALWNTLLTKESNSDYKIKNIQGRGKKVTITFNCGHSHNYHSAQAHIKKVIVWHNSTKK